MSQNSTRIKKCLECGRSIPSDLAICGECAGRWGIKHSEMNPESLLRRAWQIFKAAREIDGNVTSMATALSEKRMHERIDQLTEAVQGQQRTINRLGKKTAQLEDNARAYVKTLQDLGERIDQLTEAVCQ